MEQTLLIASTAKNQCRPLVNEFCVRNDGYTFRFRIKNKNNLMASSWSKFRSTNNLVGSIFKKRQISTSTGFESSNQSLSELTQLFNSGNSFLSLPPSSDAFVREKPRRRIGSLSGRRGQCINPKQRYSNLDSRRKKYLPDSYRASVNTSSISDNLCSSSTHSFSSSASPTRNNLSLFGPGQISNNPTPIKCSSSPYENTFSVQTPTKAIGESDQQSFHLISPPSVFPNLTSSLGKSSSHPLAISRSLKPCVLFSHSPTQNVDISAPDLYNNCNKNSNASIIPPHVSHSAFCDSSAITKDKVSVSDRALWGQFDSSPYAKTPFNELTQQENMPFLRRLSHDPYSSSNFDSIAVSTARATARNRAQIERIDLSLHEELASKKRTSSTPTKIFTFPIQAEPQLTIRRILQINSEDNWRRMAFGESETNLSSTLLAQQCLVLRGESNS